MASQNPSTQSSKMSSMNPKEVLKGEFVRRGLKVCASCEPFLSACETMQLHSRLSMFGVYPTSSLDDLLKMFKDFITGDGKYTIPDCLEELRSVGRHVPDPQKNLLERKLDYRLRRASISLNHSSNKSLQVHLHIWPSYALLNPHISLRP